MYVCIDANGRATAWNYDGTLPSEVPQGSELVEITEAQFLPLRTLRPPLFFNGTTFVPLTASAGDFMKALVETGVYDAVDAAVNAIPGQQGKLAKVLWTRASIIERNNPFVVQIGAALGINIDDLFILANSYV
jgi:hypothetical protein